MKINNERQFCTLLQKWMKYNLPFTFCWEAKLVRKKSYNYKSDKSSSKELRNLKICNRSLVTKFSDEARRGTIFDGIKIHEAAGFFFFMWQESAPKFYVIEISKIEKELATGTRSLTEARASTICDIIGVLK